MTSVVHAPFDSDSTFDKTDAALEYLRNSVAWLASGDNLGHRSVQRSVNLLKVQDIRQQLKIILGTVDTVYNHLTPVNRLPPELLGIIFEYLKIGLPAANFRDEFVPYPWPMVQSVCRYWRETAMKTPTLWEYVYISDSTGSQNVFSLSLERSGRLPLSIIIPPIRDEDGNLCDADFSVAFTQKFAAHAYRIRDLRLQCISGHDLLSAIISASRTSGCNLETLVTTCSRRRPEFFRGLKSPRLHTLCVNMSFVSDWSRSPIRSLRHLVIMHSILDVDGVIGIHALMSQNSGLEDLIFADNTWVHSEDSDEFDNLPPIEMPNLRRISVRWDRLPNLHYPPRNFLGELIETKLRLCAGYAKYYASPGDIHFPRLFPDPERCLLPVSRLFIANSCHVVGTDGHSSFSSNCSQIVELWPWDAIMMFEPNWVDKLRTMTKVKKLVLVDNFRAWFTLINKESLFPSLTDLQIRTHGECPPSMLLNFLKVRQDSEHPVETLRVMRGQLIGGVGHVSDQSFFSMQSRIEDFGQLVPFVIFQDQQEDWPRMELPSICLERSSAHEFWRPWDYMLR
ncbi:hypothetical protein BC629DRAFT_1599398 [Irpex lacteus]|nr:hypothetical protein BC629DRAFT_1599398 [Irpex lacteus]